MATKRAAGLSQLGLHADTGTPAEVEVATREMARTTGDAGHHLAPAIHPAPSTDSEYTAPVSRSGQKGRLMRWLYPDGVSWGDDVTEFDPQAVATVVRWLGLLFGDRRYFPVEVSGWAHLGRAPVMLVSNHSGGTLFLDSWGLLFAWYSHFGTARPLHPAAHEMILGNPLVGPFMAKRGVVRADKRLAQRVLCDWREDLLVMPGGDLDVWRPYRKRFEIQFAGRTGYARIALSAGVPVVPVANAGAHETFMVLTDGQHLARILRLKELARANIWPVHLSLPWGVAIGPWPHIPLPAKLRYRFGEPIRPSDVGLAPGQVATDAQVAEFDARVRAGVQSELNILRDTA